LRWNNIDMMVTRCFLSWWMSLTRRLSVSNYMWLIISISYVELLPSINHSRCINLTCQAKMR
jgi:hypothetical protein